MTNACVVAFVNAVNSSVVPLGQCGNMMYRRKPYALGMNDLSAKVSTSSHEINRAAQHHSLRYKRAICVNSRSHMLAKLAGRRYGRADLPNQHHEAATEDHGAVPDA